MPTKSSLSEAQREAIRNSTDSTRSLAKQFGVTSSTIHRVKKLGRVRQADEFSPPRNNYGKTVSIAVPKRNRSGSSWTVEAIRKARDALIAGNFETAAAMDLAMNTDDAIFVPLQNRLDVLSAISAHIQAQDSSRGKNIARKATRSVTTPRSVTRAIQRDLIQYGIAIGYNSQTPNEDGTLIDFSLHHWPMRFAKWSENRRVIEARQDDGSLVDVVHGDGTWVVFQKSDDHPWAYDACLLVAAMIWAAHAEGLKSWVASADSHGLAKIIGELPEGVALQQSADGVGDALSSEAQSFLAMLIDVVSGDAPAGIRPSGAKTDFLSNGSNMWQVFSELINGREKAAARTYLGTDAILGSVGGAPGVDISALFGVASTKIQGDVLAISAGLSSGTYAPWCAINFGDSTYAPSLVFDLPDPDGDRKSEEEAKKVERFTAALTALRASRAVITQETADTLRKLFGIDYSIAVEVTPAAIALETTPAPASAPV